LNPAQVEGILKLSDELNVSELECLRCWVKVSDPSTRRWLEVQNNAALGFYDYRIFLASREYFVYEVDTILNTGRINCLSILHILTKINIRINAYIYSDITDEISY